MKWCGIALTRLSCETMHRLDQLTVHRLLCCEVIRDSSSEKKKTRLPSLVSLGAKTLVGVGARRGAKGGLAQRAVTVSASVV